MAKYGFRLRQFSRNSLNIAEVTWIKLHYKVHYFRYFVQVTAIKSADISGRQFYELQMKDLSFSPQCLGLGVTSEEEGRGPSCRREELTWRHDMDSRETAACMGESLSQGPGYCVVKASEVAQESGKRFILFS